MDFSKFGPLTVLIIFVVAVTMLTGGVIAVVHPETLNVKDLFDLSWKLVLGLVGLAGAHAVVHAANTSANATNPSLVADPTDTHGTEDLPADGS